VLAIALGITNSNPFTHLLFLLTMKHRDWLRLREEGENLCAVLRQQGYQCLKQSRRLSWQVIKEGKPYILTWLPAPVEDWTILPNDTSPAWQRLVSIVQNGLTLRKGETTSQRTQPLLNLTRPWAIVRLLPNCQRCTIARFFNRQDAQDHVRALNRFIPNSCFEVVFEAPEIEERDEPDKP
jgi:hypothetical protein